MEIRTLKIKEICRKINRVRSVRKVAEQISILEYLGEEEISCYKLSKILKMDYSTTRRAVKKLEKIGAAKLSSVKGANGPRIKKIYRIAKNGREALKQILEKELPSLARIYTKVGLADLLLEEIRRQDKRRGKNFKEAIQRTLQK